MYKKTVTYRDFDDNERTEDLFFNYTTAEVSEMELSVAGGLTALIQKIINDDDKHQIFSNFKEIVLGAYGEKSLDGKYFVKNKEIRERFKSSAAFAELILELGTDDQKAAEFIKAVLPKPDPKRINTEK